MHVLISCVQCIAVMESGERLPSSTHSQPSISSSAPPPASSPNITSDSGKMMAGACTHTHKHVHKNHNLEKKGISLYTSVKNPHTIELLTL